MKLPSILLIIFFLLPATAFAADAIQVGDELTIMSNARDDIRGTPHIAAGPNGYLAVWREGWNGDGGTARIYAARIDSQGRLLDPNGIEIAPCKDGFQELPRVAFGGGVYLVVWQDFRNGRDYDVLGARLTPDGKVLDTQPTPIAAGPRTQSAPDIASDGQNFLVAWQAVQGDQNVYCIQLSRVSASAQIAAPTEIKSPWTKSASSPKLAWDGTSYRIVYLSQNLLTLRLTPDGAPVEKEPTLSLRGNLGPGIGFSHSLAASSQQGMLAVFCRSQPDYWGWGGPGAMICSLVDNSGKLAPGLPKEDYPQKQLANWLDFGSDKKEGSPWPHGASAVAWDGRQFIAVWQRQHIRKTVSFTNCDLIASRVDGWKPLDPSGIPVAATPLEEKNPALAAIAPGRLLCVYEKHDREGKISILARLLTTH